MKLNKKTVSRIIAGGIALLLIVGCTFTGVGIWGNNEAQSPEKTIYLKVTAEGETTSYKLETNEIYLKGALLSQDFASGSQTEVGFILDRVAEIKPDTSKNEHWRIYINGEPTAKKCDKIMLEKEGIYSLKLEN